MLPLTGHIIWRAYILPLSGIISHLFKKKNMLTADISTVALEATIESQVCNELISKLSKTEQS